MPQGMPLLGEGSGYAEGGEAVLTLMGASSLPF